MVENLHGRTPLLSRYRAYLTQAGDHGSKYMTVCVRDMKV